MRGENENQSLGMAESSRKPCCLTALHCTLPAVARACQTAVPTCGKLAGGRSPEATQAASCFGGAGRRAPRSGEATPGVRNRQSAARELLNLST